MKMIAFLVPDDVMLAIWCAPICLSSHSYSSPPKEQDSRHGNLGSLLNSVIARPKTVPFRPSILTIKWPAFDSNAIPVTTPKEFLRHNVRSLS